MDVVTLLTNRDANAYFEREAFLGDWTVEGILRYIFIKHSGQALETGVRVNAIDRPAKLFEFSEETLYVFFAQKCGTDIFVQEGWSPMNKPPYLLSQYLSKASKTQVFTNKTLKSTCVFVENITEEWKKLFCSVLAKLLFWLYPNDKPIPPEEIKLFQSFVKKPMDCVYIKKILDDCAKQIDFRQLLTIKMLNGYELIRKEVLLSQVEDELEDLTIEIRRSEEKLSDLWRQKGAAQVRLNELSLISSNPNGELIDFFSKHKQLIPKSINKTVQGGSLIFYVRDTLEFYDKEEFLRIYNNQYSCLAKTSPDIREAMWLLFGENKGVIKVESAYRTDGLLNIACLKLVCSQEVFEEYLPNPHHYFYGCLGENLQYMNRYMSSGNWDLAIEQAIAATKGLNFADSIVVGAFLRCIEEHFDTCKCIINNNGVEMTMREFLEYERKQKTEVSNG